MIESWKSLKIRNIISHSLTETYLYDQTGGRDDGEIEEEEEMEKEDGKCDLNKRAFREHDGKQTETRHANQWAI